MLVASIPCADLSSKLTSSHSCAYPKQIFCVGSVLQSNRIKSHILLRVDFAEPDCLRRRALRYLTALACLQVFCKVIVQRCTFVYILVQHILLRNTSELRPIALLAFEARASKARYQPASVLLGLVYRERKRYLNNLGSGYSS